MKRFVTVLGAVLSGIPTALLFLLLLFMTIDVIRFSLPVLAYYLPYVLAALLLVFVVQLAKTALSNR